MHCIHDMTPTISEMASTISLSSQRLYWWSQTNPMCDITPTLRMPAYALYTTSHPLFMTSSHCSYHITSSINDLKPPCLCHHTHYIWHRVHVCGCVIISTVLMISHELYFWDHFHYNSRNHIHCLRHDSHRICVIIPTRSMISHPF